jgi:hypothetical protein
LAAKFEATKERAGVVLAFDTLVVNRGEKLPALKVVTVPVDGVVDPQFAK